MNYKQARARVFVLVTCHVLAHPNDTDSPAFTQLVADIHTSTNHYPREHHLILMVETANNMQALSQNRYDIDIDVTDRTYPGHKQDWLNHFEQNMRTHCANLFPGEHLRKDAA